MPNENENKRTGKRNVILSFILVGVIIFAGYFVLNKNKSSTNLALSGESAVERNDMQNNNSQTLSYNKRESVDSLDLSLNGNLSGLAPRNSTEPDEEVGLVPRSSSEEKSEVGGDPLVRGGLKISGGSSGSVGESPAFVQNKGSSVVIGCCGSLTASATFDSNTTSGNLIIATAAATFNDSYSTASIADTANNNWTLATTTQLDVGEFPVIYIWYAKNILGGADTISVTWTSEGGEQDHQLFVSEYSGIDTSSPLNEKNSVFDGNFPVSSFSTGNIVTTNANDLLYSFLFFTPLSGTSIPSTSANWTLLNTQNDNSHIQMDDAYRIVSLINTYSNTFSGVNANYGQAYILSFKAASGGGTSGSIKFR